MFANSQAIRGNRRFKARNIRNVNANTSSYDFTQFIKDLHSQHFSTIMGISANDLLV